MRGRAKASFAAARTMGDTPLQGIKIRTTPPEPTGADLKEMASDELLWGQPKCWGQE